MENQREHGSVMAMQTVLETNLKTCFNYLLIFVSRFLPAFLLGLSAIKEQQRQQNKYVYKVNE